MQKQKEPYQATDSKKLCELRETPERAILSQAFKAKPCKICRVSFIPDTPAQLYCSPPCAESGYDAAYYRRSYGVDKSFIDAMKEAQEGRCYLCQSTGFLMREHHRQRLVVDHDHTTGAVRKLLCHNCNRGLGLFKESPDVLRRAALYILEHKEGATTIPQGSTAKRLEAHSPQ